MMLWLKQLTEVKRWVRLIYTNSMLHFEDTSVHIQVCASNTVDSVLTE